MDNAAALFVDAPVEEGHGARPALLTPSGPITYGELQRLTDRAAHALRSQGVEPEQRVALLLSDGPAWAATFFAALKLGAVAVPLNTRLDAADLRTFLADCGPKAVVTDRAGPATAGAEAAALGPRAIDFDTLVADAPAAPLGHDRLTEGGGALPPHAARLPQLSGRPGGDRRGPDLRHVEALLRLRPRQRAPDPAPRPRDDLSASGLAGSGCYRRGDARGSSDALLLGADGLRPSAPRRSARRDLRLGAPLRLGRRAAASRDLRRLAGTVRGGDPRGHRRHRDHLLGARQPARPEPRRVVGRAGAGYGGQDPGRGGPAGAGGRGRGPLGPHALAGRGLLAAARSLAPDLRGRLVPDGRRLSPRGGWRPRPLRPRGRFLQGGRAVGGSGRDRIGPAPAPGCPRRRGRRGRGGGRPHQALRVRGAPRSGRGAGGAAGGGAAVPGGRPAPPPAAAGDPGPERAAAHRDRKAPALPPAGAGPRCGRRWS